VEFVGGHWVAQFADYLIPNQSHHAAALDLAAFIMASDEDGKNTSFEKRIEEVKLPLRNST